MYFLFFLAGVETNAFSGVFYEYHTIVCGAVLQLGPVGYPTWNEASVVQAPAHGLAFIVETPSNPDSLVYKSDYGYLGQDTFVVACAHATQITCDTGYYIISIAACPPLQTFTETYEMDCDSALLVTGLGFPTWVTPEIVQWPLHGTASIYMDNSLWHTLQYQPEPGFNGIDTVVVDCAHATQITCETGIYIIHVSCPSGTTANPDRAGLSVFPNPPDGVVFLKSETEMDLARLYSEQGSLLIEKNWDFGVVSGVLRLEGLPPGVYFLEVWRSGKRTVAPVAITKY